MTWSLCMIVKNEEKTLNRCLSSCKDLFDEIIIVDTGSSDKTIQIARKFTQKVYHFKWIDDFSKARNYAFEKATKEYMMWLDADDIIEEEDLKKLKELKLTMDNSISAYFFKYNIAFDALGNPTFSYFRERLIKNKQKMYFQDPVHEYINIIGPSKYLEIAITHKKEKKEISKRNLQIYENMKKKKRKFSARNLYYYGRELYDHKQYEEAIKIWKRFLKRKDGWKEDKIEACHLISLSYQALNNNNDSLSFLWLAFSYDPPRSKTCFLIANHFLTEQNYEIAIYWYHMALNSKNKSLGFCEEDYEKFYPLLNLSLCYYLKGDYDKAKNYHEQAKMIKPYDATIIYNDQYFK